MIYPMTVTSPACLPWKLCYTRSPTLQRAVILLARDILYRHDNETTLQDVAKRSRVASLYLPFVTIVMDVYDKLWKEFNKSSRTASISDRAFDDDTTVSLFILFLL